MDRTSWAYKMAEAHKKQEQILQERIDLALWLIDMDTDSFEENDL